MNRVSIIIVTYNAAEDLQACLDSIKKLHSSQLELVVVDGGSEDGTVDILKSNSMLITKWVSEKDKGIYDAMNKGLKLITGDWVYFLGADDVLLPEFSQMLAVLKDPHTIYYGSVLARGGKYLGHLDPYRQAKIGICHQSMIYPRSVFDKYEFDLKYNISADHHLNMKCWADEEFKIEFVDYTIAIFNHTGISSTQKDDLFERDKKRLIFHYFGIRIGLRFLFREIKSKLFSRNNKAS
jgi:glycosyltransferase involved in cell wall biosynthesis